MASGSAGGKLVVLGGALSILLAIPHAGLGWPSVASRLADAQAAPDLIAGLAVAWYFGSAAMVALGGVVIALGSRVASDRRAFCAVLCVGVFYAAVGNVSQVTINQLAFVAGPGLIIFHLCGLWFIRRMRLSRERYAEISGALVERGSRSAPPSEPPP